MWGYVPQYQQNPGDVIVAKILEDWFEKQKKKDKEDKEPKGPDFKRIVETAFAFTLAAPAIVIFWKVVEWSLLQIFH